MLYFHFGRFDQTQIIVGFHNVNRHWCAVFALEITLIALWTILPVIPIRSEIAIIAVFTRGAITLRLIVPRLLIVARLLIVPRLLVVTRGLIIAALSLPVAVLALSLALLNWLVAVLAILPLTRLLLSSHFALRFGQHPHIMFGVLVEVFCCNPIIR